MIPGVAWRLLTPPTAGAVALIQLSGPAAEIESAFIALGIRPVPPGHLGLRELPGIDTLLIARPTPQTAQLMPHGGAAVVRAVLERLTDLGIGQELGRDPRAVYPEAADRLEAEMLDALARAASPRAVDLLLAQPARWRKSCAGLGPEALPPGPATARDRVLGRLISPPLVVALGAANIGKSTLCNALAGREVALVADEPGTTRDHVGVLIEVDGLVVRYVDTPGVREGAGPIEAEAARLAAAVVEAADLLLLCGDPSSRPPPPPSPPTRRAPGSELRVCLRSDLGIGRWERDVSVSVSLGLGVEGLARAIRERLVPQAELESAEPWRFWEGGSVG